MIRSILAALFLAACTSTPTVIVQCPPIVPYSDEFQDRAADQLETLPEGSPLAVMIEDYGSLRDQILACVN